MPRCCRAFFTGKRCTTNANSRTSSGAKGSNTGRVSTARTAKIAANVNLPRYQHKKDANTRVIKRISDRPTTEKKINGGEKAPAAAAKNRGKASPDSSPPIAQT